MHTHSNQPAARLPLASLLLAILCAAAAAQPSPPPQVAKVEPPNWWANHSINPVRLLVRGSNLGGARVEAVSFQPTNARQTGRPGEVGVRTGLVRTNERGTYLFLDVHVEPNARPGRRSIRLRTQHGAADFNFDVVEPLARAGRFQGFTPDDVIYFIMPDRFADGDTSNNNPAKSPGLYDRAKGRHYHGGDFQGIIDRLPYLKDLGVTALWINPVYDNTDRLDERELAPEVAGGPKRPTTAYHGYGAIDMYGVEEHYGDMRKLRELVDRAHALGLKVIQDQIANHTSPYHPWATDRPTPTWYYGTAESHLSNNWQKWTAMSPYATDETRRRNLEGWFIDILPDLNQDDEEVRRYLIQNTLWWLGTVGFDAIRMDTLPHVPRHFWRDWSAAIRREYPAVNVLGELFDGDPALLAYFQRGRAGRDGIDPGIDTLYDFALFYAVRDAFAKGQPVRKLAQVLSHDWLYPDARVLVPFLGVHDMERFMSEPGATTDGLKLAQTFVMTTRGTPLLYYGDEIAMPGGADPDNRRDFPGGFPDDARNAFTRAGRTAAENDVFNHLRRLARLRAELAPLRRGSVLHIHDEEQQTAFARTLGGEAVVIAFNNDTKPAAFEIDVRAAGVPDAAELTDRLGVVTGAARVSNGRIGVTLPARSASLFAAAGN